jgi:hypothetical protein
MHTPDMCEFGTDGGQYKGRFSSGTRTSHGSGQY